MALKDIIGQDRAVNILLKTIQRGRIPSSYLFAGEAGIGKKFTAVNLAKALNCLKTVDERPADSSPTSLIVSLPTSDSCDECSSCKKIDSGMHPDFLLVSPEGGQIRIEEIRAIADVLSLKAFEGRYKVVIVDEADAMNLYAANAFLKTLEEPPENSLLILVSSNPDRLPDTIRSRCSRITFTPLSQGACREVIDKVFSQRLTVSGKKSGRQVNSEADIPHGHTAIDSRLSTLVRLSMGRPGEAVAADLIEERTWFLKLLKGMLNVERDGWGSKEDMERWYDLVLILLRDMAVMKITGDEADLINSDLKEYISRLCNSMDIKGIIEQYQRLNAMKGYFPFHLNKSLTWNYTGSLLRKDMDTTHA